MKKAVLFDLGNTLVQYYVSAEFPEILRDAISEVQGYLRERGLLKVSPEVMWQRVEEENHEAEDNRVRLLEDRLVRIFQLDSAGLSAGVKTEMCRCFLKPIFARARGYDDAIPALKELRGRGLKTAIVSNTPWGSPGAIWREEIERLGLAEHADAVVFCDDVGWRKPAREVFEFALEKLGVVPEECVFVGDDPRWDLLGPRGMGIEAVLVDRTGGMNVPGENPIGNLRQLPDRL